MPTRTSYDHGTPSWADLSTSDTAAAKAFYTGLFGWTAHDQPVGEGQFYTMLHKGDHVVAALSAQQPQQAEPGIPPHWNTYVTVDDIAATTARAAELGADVHVPVFDVMDAGKMSVLQDPTGAFIALWQADKHIGAALVNAPGALTWNELLTDDVDRAGTFYANLFGWESTLFGWESTANPTPMGTYTCFMRGEHPMAGMMAITEQMGPTPPNWMVYFGVANADAAAAKVGELGGDVLMPPTDFPGVGRGAVVQDPQGAVFSIIQLESWMS